MILALQLSHFTAAALFAFFFSIVFGITQRNTPNEMFRYGAYCFAMAMAGKPKLMLADEPTTALDVTIQDQILSLLVELQAESGMALVLVSHDMGVIAETCDRVAVMYAGRVAEIGPVHEVINQPAHPYTLGLMAAIPDITQDRERLYQIDGTMPRLNAIPNGCAYNPRCPRVFDRCRVERPDLLPAGATRAACWLHDAAAGVPLKAAA